MADSGREPRGDYIAAVVKAITFIESSLEHQIDLDTVCRHAHLSKFYFSRIFQAMVGETVFDYVRKRRLAEIAHRLVTTTQPILDLAFRFGYESQQSMSKAFRSQYGIAPGAYRRAGTDRFFYHRARVSRETIERLHRDMSLRAHVYALPALHLLGLRATMPITDPDPVNATRLAFRTRAEAIAPLRRYRGVFEVTLMRREQRLEFTPDDPFDGFIGYAVIPGAQAGAGSGAVPRVGSGSDSASESTAAAGFTEMTVPASRYLTFYYTGADSIGQLSSLYRYIFSSGLAERQEQLADRDFFHYYRPGAGSMLFFLPIE